MTGEYKTEQVGRKIIVKNRQKVCVFFDRCILDAVLGRKYNKNDVKENRRKQEASSAIEGKGLVFLCLSP